MRTNNIKKIILSTLKMQPIVILYSFVSIGSKMASKYIPGYEGDIFSFIIQCILEYRLILILGMMCTILFVYAILWQKAIKGTNISVMYANKSSYMFWTQLAAVIIFHERITWNNALGICLIFLGILIVNNRTQE